MNKLDIFNQSQIKKNIPEMRPGDILRVHQKIKEGGKEKTQAFEGVLIAKKHGKGPSTTITVRRDSFGIAVERIYPIHSNTIEKIEVVSRAKKVRRAKLYYLRRAAGKKRRVKQRILEEHETPKSIVRDERARGISKEKKLVGKEKPKGMSKKKTVKESKKSVMGGVKRSMESKNTVDKKIKATI